MASPHAEPFAAPALLRTAALSFLTLFLVTATAVQSRERLWTVTCGLPQQNNPFLDLMPAGGYNGPWQGDPRSGHLMVKTLNRPHPDGGISGEMWLLSRSVGWWMLKAIRVHPDDRSKVTFDIGENRRRQIRQIIDSPFLSQPAVIRAGVASDEELVNGQILAKLPDAFRLRCAQRSDGPDAARVAAAQRALARHGHDPGPIDGRMGPRTRAALRAFQSERGFASHGQLDDATFERLTAR